MKNRSIIAIILFIQGKVNIIIPGTKHIIGERLKQTVECSNSGNEFRKADVINSNLIDFELG